LAASAAPVVCIDVNVCVWLVWGRRQHVKLDSPSYVFLTKIMRDNSPHPIYAILHGTVSCKGYFALALVNPKDKSKVVCNNFPCFDVDGKPLLFVTEFKHLGHVITCSLSDD